MAEETLAQALEREHREIDAGIEAFARAEAEDARLESLTRAMAALRRHIYLEEEFLFPPMRPKLAVPMIVMLREHGEIWRTLDDLGAKLAAEPGGAAVADLCRELLALLERHNAKEEPIFYPRADTELTPEDKAQLGAFLESGTMPDGWVCHSAVP